MVIGEEATTTENERADWQQFLLRGSLFVGLFLLLWFGSNALAGGFIDSFYELKYAELFNPEYNADVVILGSSKAVRGINPDLLNEEGGLMYYNFGYNASNPVFYQKWYVNLFAPNYPEPKLVVYAVDWLMFIDGFRWREFEQDSEYFPLGTFVQTAMADDVDRQAMFFNRFPVIKDKERIGLKLLGQKMDYDYDMMELYAAGYVPRSADIQVRGFDSPPPNGVPNNPEQIAAFEQLLDALSADGIPVVLIQIPEYLPATQPDQDKLALLQQIAKERNITYIDYNTVNVTDINSNAELFLDWAHMSEAGSEVFTEQLRSDLNSVLQDMELQE